MPIKPKVGVLLLASGWFYDVGLQDDQLNRSIKVTVEEIKECLASRVEVVYAAEVHSQDMAFQAVKKNSSEGIDLVVLCFMTWVEDQIFQTIIDQIDPRITMVIWCFNPFEKFPRPIKVEQMLLSSGGVGVLQSSGLLKRKAIRTGFIFGSHRRENVMAEIERVARAAALRNMLRNLNIGVIPYRCNLMTSTYVDEFKLKNELGPTLKYFSVSQYLDAMKSVDGKLLTGVIDKIRDQYEINKKVTPESLTLSAEASLALDELAGSHDLGAIAMDDLSNELHQQLGLRPGLRLPGMLKHEDLVVSMEGDIGAAVALYVLRQLSGKPCLYSEPLTYDLAENTVLLGHAGFLDASMVSDPRNIKIMTDYEYQNSDRYPGAMNFFVGDPGQVTLLSCSYNGTKFQFVFTRGESVATELVLDQGYAHMLIRLKMTIEQFFQRGYDIGITQHWAIGYGDISTYLKPLAFVLGDDADVLSLT